MNTTTQASNRSPAGSGRASVWEKEARAVGRVPLSLGAGLAILAGYALFSAIPRDAQAVPIAQPASNVEPASAVEPEAKEETDADAATKNDANSRPEVSATGTDVEPGDEELATDSTREREPSRPTKKKRTKTPEPSTKTLAPAPSGPTVNERIDAAVERGWMRAASGLLLVFPDNRPMSWDAATKLCRRRRDGGLDRWRLPTVAELKALRQSRALPRGDWWSSTDGHDGGSAFTLGAATAAGEASKQEGRALPVCVITRQSTADRVAG